MTRVLIVGGGASGVLLAAHLLRDHHPGLLVTLIEQRGELGAGVAYSTKDPGHLLNVRASNMSAYPDDPEHFFRWLRHNLPWSGSEIADASSFAPRQYYRDYLGSLLKPHFLEGRLRVVRGEAVSLSENENGVAVHFRDGSSRIGDRIVLATGNEGPSLPHAPWRFDGWSAATIPAIPRDAPVVIIGTGLTMVDWLLTLLHAGHGGPITAISRHGLMPQAHRTVPAIPMPAAKVPFGRPLSQLTRWLRSEVRKVESNDGDWRSVLDSLRPHTQHVWQELGLDDRRRFLRHARAWWDQHRHRIAPDAAAKVQDAQERGQFRIVAGRLIAFEDRDGDEVDVIVAKRNRGAKLRIRARAVFECRGRASDVTKTENPVLRSLLHNRQARPDPLRLGLDVTSDGALISHDGRISERVYAVGPVTSGVFWEITAVPDIRVQVAALAKKLYALNEADRAASQASGSADAGSRHSRFRLLLRRTS